MRFCLYICCDSWFYFLLTLYDNVRLTFDFVCSSTLLDYAMIFMTKPWLTEQATSLVIFILERWFVVHCIVELVMGNLFLFALKFLLWPMSNWWDLLTRLKLNSDGYYQIKHWGKTYTVTTSYNLNNIDLNLQNTF